MFQYYEPGSDSSMVQYIMYTVSHHRIQLINKNNMMR